MSDLKITDSPAALSGIGDTRAKQLEKLGIRTVYDLISFYPRAYENRGKIIRLSDGLDGETHAYLVTVSTEIHSARVKNNMTVSKCRVFDESGSIDLVFFNSPFVKDVFKIGMNFRIFGKILPGKMRNYQMISPKYEVYSEGVPLPDFLPVYPLTEGISSKLMAKWAKEALDRVLPQMQDPLPDSLRTDLSLPVISSALRNIHNPENDAALASAVRRLAFDEMLLFGLAVSQTKSARKYASAVAMKPCSLKPLLETYPFTFTDGQKEAVNAIYSDIVGKNGAICVSPMARILVGDVGSGKTAVAECAMYIAAMSKKQSTIMVPTAILAEQHYAGMSKRFGKLGIHVELLTAATRAAERKRILSSVASGETDILIGTHSLLSNAVTFHSLGLVVTDEQHRFGVRQRALLKQKSDNSHLLIMSATPIPRTLALSMYGDLDVSKMASLPNGRIPIETYVVDSSYKPRLAAFMKRQIDLGGQCYVVCPSIEPQAEDEIDLEVALSNAPRLKSTEEVADELRRLLPGVSLAVLHGKMKEAEKDAIMGDFNAGKTKILVSTTVIEVGVNVPNATLMLVINAERFGLATLHQLRGRVGRGTKKSYCVLLSDDKNQVAQERLGILKSSTDGFVIAEKDLLLRGPGQFFGDSSDISLKQSGGFHFRMASLCPDTSLFDLAFRSAKEICEKDPNFLLPEHAALGELLRKTMTEDLSVIN